MPRPISVLGVEQVDPTLPNIIIAPLYERDEYQTYSLIFTKSVPYSYGDLTPEETEELIEDTEGTPTGFEDYQGNPVNSGGNRHVQIKETERGFTGTTSREAFLMQTFSLDGYEWCDGLGAKLTEFFESYRFMFKIIPLPPVEIVTEFSPGDRVLMQVIIPDGGAAPPQVISGLWVEDDTDIKFTYQTGGGTTVESTRRGYFMFVPNVRKKTRLIYKLAYQGTVDKSLLNFFLNNQPIENIQFEHNAEEIESVSVTYFYQDGLCRKNELPCFSRGYRIINASVGLNQINFRIGQSILPCSVVVTTLTGNGSLKTAVETAINEVSENHLFDNFDSVAPNLAKTTFEEQGFNLAIEMANPFCALHANNNYWDNGAYLQNIGLEQFYGQNQDVTLIDNVYYSKSSDDFYGTDMPDSVRVQEIHAALEAQKFANNSTTNNARVANVGYYVERIARVLGISVHEDGSIKSIRQVKRVKPGETIPPGWDFGQFGTNITGIPGGQPGGNPNELRDGIVYEQRSNNLIGDKFDASKAQIESGGYMLCENIPQLLSQILDDLDKALSWQEIAAGGIPAADGSNKVMLYEGMGSVIAEMAFMLSRMSLHTSQNLIATRVTQGVSMEILQALGVAVNDNDMIIAPAENGKELRVNYPGFDHSTPTVTQQIGWLLQNIGVLVAAQVVYDESDRKK